MSNAFNSYTTTLYNNNRKRGKYKHRQKTATKHNSDDVTKTDDSIVDLEKDSGDKGDVNVKGHTNGHGPYLSIY